MASTPHLRQPDSEHVRREWDTVGENDLRLNRDAAARIVTALNADLSGQYILFNQVRKHSWLVEGAESNSVRNVLEDAADRLSEMTDALAVRVHALGGVPVCGPMGVRQHAPLYIESPHQYDVRSSLERDLDGYATLAVQMREHIELTERMDDEATAEMLREHLETIEEDADTLDRYLDDDTLVRRG
ncbi:DNA starvation/stationary phase protection protein DpsA [Haloplanus sp. C73]|uniref:DNA starvation/stationary phase protection protein DpsA n=1 Tax=Haloplanus sp. C73 TaxID=3421641 RepID=UPI003EB71C33